jgi:Holliday junction resolvase
MQDALSFALFYEEAIEELENLTQLKKATLGFDPAIYLKVVKDEFQWHFCDAIVRAKEATLENINEKYKNSREFQEREVQKFEENIGRCRRRFTPGTAELADKCVSEVRASIHKKQDSSTRTQRGIADIDGMEGHDFEYWCAGLLKNNGFSNVEVTRGSGDQGVDIVAEKGGIKYAIQCKCYSSDLGNKPVQEVAAGKSFYHCQVGAVMTNRYFTAGAKELANANGILLWDRDALSAMLDNV